MSLSSLQLDAFYEVVRARSFSKAAQSIYLSQSALSQRILNLEDELGTSLLIRGGHTVSLTEAGEKLARYCEVKKDLEAEVIQDIGISPYSGEIRIGCFSTIAESVVLPSVKDLVFERSHLKLNLLVKEIRDLYALLRNNEAKYIITDDIIESDQLEYKFLGYESNILIEPKTRKTDVYLDHDFNDQTTYNFLKQQGIKNIQIKRSYLDNIQAIIKGVELGLGKAVVPEHLIKNNKKVKITRKGKKLKVPLYLHFYKQTYYTKLHNQIIESLTKNCKNHL